MLGWALSISLLVAFAPGGAELELIDGTSVRGISVSRDGDTYVLVQEGGTTVTLPVELVLAVRLFGKGEVPAPTGVRRGGPRTLAGEEVRPPTPSQQIQILGTSSKFQKSMIDPSWTPESDWDMDPEKQNNFAPSKWQESPIDPNWKPKSAWDRDEDVLAGSRSKWQEPIVDNSWKPTDGFKRD